MAKTFQLILLFAVMLGWIVLWSPVTIFGKSSVLCKVSNTDLNMRDTSNPNHQSRTSLEANEEIKTLAAKLEDILSVYLQERNTKGGTDANDPRNTEWEQMLPKGTKRNMDNIGEWKPGAKYLKMLENRWTDRCGEKERNLHFEFFNKSLNDLDDANIFLSKVKGKTMTILGDSIQRGLFWGLIYFLQLGK